MLETSSSSTVQEKQSSHPIDSVQTPLHPSIPLQPNPRSLHQQYKIAPFIVLGILVLGLGAGFVVRKQTTSQSFVSQIVPTSMPSPTSNASQDETQYWRTVSLYGVSFQYPPDWNPKIGGAGKDVRISKYTGSGEVTIECLSNDCVAITINLLPESDRNETTLDLAKRQFTSANFEAIQIGNQDATQVTGEDLGEVFEQAAFLVLKNPEGKFAIIQIQSPVLEKYTSIMNRIFQTVKISSYTKEDKVAISQKATKALQEVYPLYKVEVGDKELNIDNGWAHGTAALMNPKAGDGGVGIALFLSHKENGEWEIIPETDTRYKTLFQQLPDTVISKEVKDFLK